MNSLNLNSKPKIHSRYTSITLTATEEYIFHEFVIRLISSPQIIKKQYFTKLNKDTKIINKCVDICIEDEHHNKGFDEHG